MELGQRDSSQLRMQQQLTLQCSQWRRCLLKIVGLQGLGALQSKAPVPAGLGLHSGVEANLSNRFFGEHHQQSAHSGCMGCCPTCSHQELCKPATCSCCSILCGQELHNTGFSRCARGVGSSFLTGMSNKMPAAATHGMQFLLLAPQSAACCSSIARPMPPTESKQQIQHGTPNDKGPKLGWCWKQRKFQHSSLMAP